VSSSDPRRPLPALPEGFAATREALHRVAERIVAPARKPDNEISLRATPGGFGTPAFEHLGVERRVRVDGVELVYELGGAESRAPLTSLASAGALVAELLPADADLDDSPLTVDPEAARALAAWFELGAHALDGLSVESGPGDDATAPRLWPEHFDVAIEAGDEAAGRRANYGFSPGDEHHPEPYLYVGPWSAEVSGALWTGRGFNGAELGYADLAAAEDQLEGALDFCRTRRVALGQFA
jgi:hypothetical protein